MNGGSNNVSDFPTGPHEVVPAAGSETRPLYWSVRRELWENRWSIWRRSWSRR